MKKREISILKCRYITPIEWEQINDSEKQYFENAVKISGNGDHTYCCSGEIIKSLAERINKYIIPKAYKSMKNKGEMIEYIFVLEQENRIIKINIPTILIKDEYYIEKYPFVKKDVEQYNKIYKLSNNIRKSNNVRETCKKTAAAILSAITLATAYMGTRKLIDHLSQPAPSREHYTYNEYYGNIMREEKFNENVDNLRKSYEKTKEKYKRK